MATNSREDKQMAKEVILDGIMLSSAATSAWHEMASRVATALQHISRVRGATPSIPDERARVNDDGTLTIFVNIPDAICVSMDVPAGHWGYWQ